jgi:hypothetical protein
MVSYFFGYRLHLITGFSSRGGTNTPPHCPMLNPENGEEEQINEGNEEGNRK